MELVRVEAGDKLVVNNNGELLAVEYVSQYPQSQVVRVREPDGNEFVVHLEEIITFTNRYTIQVLEDLLETMKISIKK
jgi:hypothetical protein